jgi:hypothetical protein
MARLVVVLGAEPEVDMERLARDAWEARVELVILNLGFPLTSAQNAAIDIAMDWAGRGVLELEARISYTPEDAASQINEEDRVVLALSQGEKRRVEKALRKKGRANA